MEDSDRELQTASSPMKTLLVPFIEKFLACDRERSRTVLEAWRHWLQNVDARGIEEFHTIEDYLKFRVINCGLL